MEQLLAQTNKILAPIDKAISEIGKFIMLKPRWAGTVFVTAVVVAFILDQPFKFSQSDEPAAIVSPVPPAPTTAAAEPTPTPVPTPIATPENTVASNDSPKVSADENIPSPPSSPTTTIEHNSESKWKTETVKRGDSLSKIFKRAGLSPQDLHAVVSLGGSSAKTLTHLQPGQSVHLLISPNHHLEELVYQKTNGDILTINRTSSGFQIGTPSQANAAAVLDVAAADTPPPAATSGQGASSTSPASSTSTADNTAAAKKGNWQIVTIKSGDTLTKIFKRNHLSSKDLQAISDLDHKKVLRKLQPHQEMRFLLDAKHQLQQIMYVEGQKTLLWAIRTPKAWQLQSPSAAPATSSTPTATKTATASQTPASKSSLTYASADIHTTLSGAAHKAGLSDKQVAQLTTMFSEDNNILKNVHAGDQISVLYEEKTVTSHNGKKKTQEAGDIVVADLKTQGKDYELIRFTDPKGHTDYYTPEGMSLHQTIEREPIKFTHISSYFSSHRMEPLLHFYRPHMGVDFAAPSGTPVKAAGSGIIAYLGNKGGYGRTILIKHDDKYSTLYAHLASYAPGIADGKSVQQGQTIGFVGRSGLATGPHLHYEIHVNNVPNDPLTVALPGAPIPKSFRSQFLAQAKTLIAELGFNQQVKLAEKADPNKNS